MNKTQENIALDGNAIAGLLQHLFTRDLTTSETCCENCGRKGEVGSLLAYNQAPGVVLRCPACKEVIARMVTTTKELYLDLRGTSYIRIQTLISEP